MIGLFGIGEMLVTIEEGVNAKAGTQVELRDIFRTVAEMPRYG